MTADVLVLVALALVAVAGTAVVLTHDPARQAVTLSLSGLALTVLFVVLQAPGRCARAGGRRLGGGAADGDVGGAHHANARRPTP